MARIKIPECSNPFEVTVNGRKYSYEAGIETDVPDEVAVIIEKHNKAHKKETPKTVAPFGGGGVLHPLTLTGAVEAEYDGSQPLSVEIPEGEKEFVKVIEHRTTEDLTYISFTEDLNGNPLSFEEAFIFVATARPTTETTTGYHIISLQPQWSASFNQYGICALPMAPDMYCSIVYVKKHSTILYELRLVDRRRIAANASALTISPSECFSNHIAMQYGAWSGAGSLLRNNENDKSVFNAEGKFYGITVGVDGTSSMKIGAGAVVEVWAR